VNLLRLFKRKPKKGITISAVVIRGDGTKQDLGVISRGPVEMKPEAK
jgi:hypothetical protein